MAGRARRGSRCGPVEGHPPGRAARPRSTSTRPDRCARATSVLFVHPVGPALDHRHDRHRRGTADQAHPRGAAADIDYLLDQANRCWSGRSTTRRRRGRVRRAAAAARRRVPRRSETTKLSREHLVARPVAGLVASPAASTRPTGSWPPTRSTRSAQELARAGAAVAHRAHPAAGALRLRRGSGTQREATGRRDRRARRARSSTCCGRHGVAGRELLDLIAQRARARPSRCTRRALPRRRGRPRRDPRGRPAPRRRARTHGPGSRSRPGTAPRRSLRGRRLRRSRARLGRDTIKAEVEAFEAAAYGQVPR